MSVFLLKELALMLEEMPSVARIQKALDRLTDAFACAQGAVFTLLPDGGTAHLPARVGLEAANRETVRLSKTLADVLHGGAYRVLAGKKLGADGALVSDGAYLLHVLPLRRNDEYVGALLLAAEKEKTLSKEALRTAAALMAAVADIQRPSAAGVLQSGSRPYGFVGGSPAMVEVYRQISHVTQSNTTVLITGESGTGKELAARAIHAAGSRASGPFISLNCAALPENLVENELFGHEKGAFTGAVDARPGRFELASGGTLFLDEVGELTPLVQAKLLRVLQEHCVERLGAIQNRQIDVRIITATNRDLEAMVQEKTFRRDLFYRLNVFPVHMPALRERASDILPLSMHFIQEHAAANGKKNIRLSLSVQDMLQRYDWPGNVRELANVMERAVLLVEDGGLVLPQHLPRSLHSKMCPFGKGGVQDGGALSFGPLQERLDELERGCILDALERFRGHMGHAAEALCISERVMALRMKKYGITYKTFRAGKRETQSF